MTKRPIHRISYQCDDFIITTCGVRIPGTRKQIAKLDWLTIWNHGEATCAICHDETKTLPLPLLAEVLQVPNRVTSSPMLPKQIDNIFDVLEIHDCHDITLRRVGCMQVGGHDKPIYVLQVRQNGEVREWRDHALYRLMAEAVVDVTRRATVEDDEPAVRPEIP